MTLREFKQMLIGSDNLEVVVVTDDEAFTIHSVEEGINEDTGKPELWIVTGGIV